MKLNAAIDFFKCPIFLEHSIEGRVYKSNGVIRFISRSGIEGILAQDQRNRDEILQLKEKKSNSILGRSAHEKLFQLQSGENLDGAQDIELWNEQIKYPVFSDEDAAKLGDLEKGLRTNEGGTIRAKTQFICPTTRAIVEVATMEDSERLMKLFMVRFDQHLRSLSNEVRESFSVDHEELIELSKQFNHRRNQQLIRSITRAEVLVTPNERSCLRELEILDLPKTAQELKAEKIQLELDCKRQADREAKIVADRAEKAANEEKRLDAINRREEREFALALEMSVRDASIERARNSGGLFVIGTTFSSVVAIVAPYFAAISGFAYGAYRLAQNMVGRGSEFKAIEKTTSKYGQKVIGLERAEQIGSYIIHAEDNISGVLRHYLPCFSSQAKPEQNDVEAQHSMRQRSPL